MLEEYAGVGGTEDWEAGAEDEVEVGFELEAEVAED